MILSSVSWEYGDSIILPLFLSEHENWHDLQGMNVHSYAGSIPVDKPHPEQDDDAARKRVRCDRLSKEMECNHHCHERLDIFKRWMISDLEIVHH
jgi:hypothetical protein